MKKTVKIGPQIFDITVTEDLRDGDLKLDGLISYHKSSIVLDADLNEFAEIQVLWHEIVHGILNNAGIKDVKEETIDALATGILGVLQDNKWITE